MSLKLTYNGAGTDLELGAFGLKTGDELEAAVVVALFSDRLASARQLPAGETNRRGWCLDQTLPTDGDNLGSLLWTLRREKITPELLTRFEAACNEALRPFVDEGVAASYAVTVERRGLYRVDLLVVAAAPTGERYNFQYDITGGGA